MGKDAEDRVHGSSELITGTEKEENMNTLILLQQMLILFAMMVAGFIAGRKKWIDDRASSAISGLVVNLFNPFLILTSVASNISDETRLLIGENFILVLLFYAFLALCAAVYVKIRRFGKKENRRQQLMILLPNVGFMGVPLVRALFGEEYVIFVVFYMMMYNVIAYTYGIVLAFGMSETKQRFQPRMLFNTGFLFTILAVVLFFLRVPMPSPAATFCSYMGNVTIPLSMVLIGFSLAQIRREDARAEGRDTMIFFLVRMLLIPAAGILLVKILPFDHSVKMIADIMLCMPVGSLTGMLAETYGHCGAPVNRTVAITTILSVATIPLLSILF